jgi:serine/threonine protein kinase
MKEVQLLRRCAPHASLLPLLGYCFEAAHAPCLVFPLCLGGTLEDRLMPHSTAAKTRLLALGWAEPPAPLAWRARLAVLRDAARALVHLQSQRLLHGDVKPSNILLDAAGSSARLADFGLARAAKRQESAALGASAASVSSVKGSAAFLDPI